MATDAYTRLSIPLAAAVLLWPAVWNGYPIVFADTGTYLSQAIHLYLGWDRPVFYSLALFVLHWKIALWPAIVAQALLAAWVLALTLRALSLDRRLLPPLALGLSLLSWLPWLVCEIMPDSFTHGTSAQRMRWFQRGFEGGDPDNCDTFSAARL